MKRNEDCLDAPEVLVSIVVVCFNGLDITRRCLESLFNQDYQSKEIVVVDNGSQEDIKGMVAAAFPQARFIRLESNQGFSGGYNRGMEAARGKYVAIINNDAVASPQWVKALVEAAEGDQKTGAVASVIIDGNKPDVLDSCGVGMALDGMSRQLMRGQPPPAFVTPKEVFLPSGCACLFRADALKIVGFFDESFFAYCEDTDLGLRLRWAGFKTVVAPDARVTHYYSLTSGKYSLKKVFWVERNHLWVAVKNFPFFLLIFLPFATGWRYIIQLYAILTHSGDLNLFTVQAGSLQVAVTLVRAYLSAAIGMPSILRKRLSLMRRRKINHLDMMKMIWHFKISMVEVIIGTRRSL